MTKEELKIYADLNVQFKTSCERVINELKRYDKFEYGYLSSFYLLNNGEVLGEGTEYGSFQYCEDHTGYFNSELLTYTDEQLKLYVDDLIAAREKEAAEEYHQKKIAERENDMKEFERLRKKLNIC